MNIQCSSCQTRLRVDPTKYTQTVVVVQCPNCGQRLRVTLSKRIQTLSVSQAEKFEVFKEADDVKPLQETKPFLLEDYVVFEIVSFIVAVIICVIVGYMIT